MRFGVEKKNKRNYEIQSYIENLNHQQTQGYFHQTCKSGKDRTNAALEKQKAKKMLEIHSGKVSRYGKTETMNLERALFEKGFLQGPGNDICGDNMKPGLQQVSSGDIPCRVDLNIVKAVAEQQKGIDKLKLPSPKKHQVILEQYNKIRNNI